MATAPVTFRTFGGLNVDDDPIAVGSTGATDLLNVSFDTPGKLRTRDGYAKVSTSAASASILYLVPLTATTPYKFLSISLTEVNLFDLGTGVRTLVTALGPNINATRPAAFGTLAGGFQQVFWATDASTSGRPLLLYESAGGTAGASTGSPQYVCAIPISQRLAQAGFFAAADSPSGANGSQATVFFSDAGNPAAYTATNFVTIDPGDGERFTGLVSWDGSMWAFKNSKAYQFYGESTSSTGAPIFNYRRIQLPDPIPATAIPTAWQSVAAGPDGIYYAGTTGLWRIADGVQRVPTPIDGILAAMAGSSLSVGTVGQVRMEWAGPLLFIVYALGSAAQRVLVWDTRTNKWTVHSYAHTVTSVPTFAPGTGTATWFGASNGHLYETSSASTTDDGTAVSWSWKSGKYVFDEEQRVAITRESSLFGTGTVTLTLSSDRYADQSGSVTLGTAPTPAEGFLQKDQEGRFFQHTLSGSGAATVEAVTHNVSTVKPAGIA